MNNKEAFNIIGSLSQPSKMSGYGWSIPTTTCKTGSKLRNIPGSVCEKCYARKGNYRRFKHVSEAQNRRLRALNNPLWSKAMVHLIKHYSDKSGVFRWHDSGDLQSIDHLRKIVNIARRTPNILHWLPTKETKLVKLAISKGLRIPKNLCVRHSVHIVGEMPAQELKRLCTSTVNSQYGFICPVQSGKETCNTYNCRACWDKTIKNIDYRNH